MKHGQRNRIGTVPAVSQWPCLSRRASTCSFRAEHASNHHGKGTLVTSDDGTRTLYEKSDFDVSWVDLHEREQFEGWRIRQTCMMLSTVYDDEATRMVLAPSVPSPVIEWLIEQDGLYRFSQINTSPHAG